MSAKPYAQCNDCAEAFNDRAAIDAHMSATFEAGKGRSHSIRVVNPTPEELEARRLRRLVADEVDNAIDSAMNRLDDIIAGGEITEKQVARELASWPDFADAWEEYNDD